MAQLIWALGLVLLIEGLVWALAPQMIEDLLRVLRDMPLPQRRLAGLAAMSLGLALAWLGHLGGAG